MDDPVNGQSSRDPRLTKNANDLNVSQHNITDLNINAQESYVLVKTRNNKRKAEILNQESAAGKKYASNNITISNSFEPLCEMSEDAAINEPKPPPIFVPGIQSLPSMLSIINNNSVNNNEYTYKIINRNQMKINPTTGHTYCDIVKNLKASNIDFHTFQLKQNRAFRVVLRHIHHSVNTADISQELSIKGHSVRNIFNIRHRISKEPLSLFFVDLDPAPNNKDIYKIEFLHNAKINFEPPHKKRDVVQCKRCQRYGHTRAYCMRHFRCVKCGEDHETKDCKKPKDTDAKCALCEGKHPANFKGCNVYREIKIKKFPPLRERTSAPVEKCIPPVNTGSDNFPPLIHNQQSPPPPSSSMPNASNSPSYSNATKNCQHRKEEYAPTDHLYIMQQCFADIKRMIEKQAEQTSLLITLLTTLVNKLK